VSGLFCFGFGYSALRLAGKLKAQGWRIAGTARSAAKRAELEAQDYAVLPFDATESVQSALAASDHVLVSVPPVATGEPVLDLYCRLLQEARPSIRWLGYLSTTAVYGDRGGGWVDETSAPAPTTTRGRLRLAAEEGWRALHLDHGLPVHIFRLAGIYGPGRNQILALLSGTARRIVKPGQIFSRIHVDDIAGVLQASMSRPAPGRCYNVCDDEPAPPQDVVAYAAQLLGVPPPPEIPFAEAGLIGLSRSFYEEAKRVCNRRIKDELGYVLLYPTYREGLSALKL
jgi:nucleoside-diphosphate-sugar epimerase